MMYELEFVLLEEQRVIDHASRQQRHDTNSTTKETYISKRKGAASRNSKVTQSSSQCCVPCC